ncbi:MAG: hypothetical protein MPN21_04450 [Thermoanaerobaculia bacterium]|nr:hypothetical protein [Thermoanaerobaculia bacterium]
MNLTAHDRHRQDHRRDPLRSRLALLFCVAALLFFAGSVGADPWIHIQVEEGRNGDRVSVNLPVSLMRAAVNMIPNDVHADIELEFDDVDLDWHELRTFWDEVRRAPEMTFVTVETRDENIAVRKEGDMIVIRTLERSEYGTEINMQMPAEVIDALLSGPEGRFDFAAALDALVDHAPGQLMTVRDGDDRVRIWIDDNPEAHGD